MVTVSLVLTWLFRRSKEVFVVKNHSENSEKPVFREDTRKNQEQVLTIEQKNTYKEAEEYIEQGNFLKAAKLLESIGMIRKAVDILESNNHIQVAADILLRIKKPERAGIIFARASMWKEAVNCFIEANLPEEVAKCSKLAGDYETAALYFEKSNNYIDAAHCYEKRARYRDAFRCFKDASLEQKAFEVLKLEISQHHSSKLKLNKDELLTIEKFVAMGEGNEQLVEILNQEDRIAPLFDSLIQKNFMASAIEVYKKSPQILGKKILNDINSSEENAEKMLNFLQQLNEQSLLAQAFKKLKKHKAAAIAFENNGNFEMALKCYKESKDGIQVARLTKLIAEHKSPNIRRLFPKTSVAKDCVEQPQTPSIDYQKIFSQVPLWRSLSDEQIKAIWALGTTRDQRAGTQVLTESKEHEHLVIILDGTIEACNTQGEYVQKFTQGDIIATKALISRQTKELSYHITSDATFIKIQISSIQSMMDNDGSLARKIYQSLVSKPSAEYQKAN